MLKNHVAHYICLEKLLNIRISCFFGLFLSCEGFLFDADRSGKHNLMTMLLKTSRRLSFSVLILVSLFFCASSVSAESDLRLVNAAEIQDWDSVSDLLQRGVRADTSRADGVTALLWAAHWDAPETVDLLLNAGADVNAAEDHGVTPLARACLNASVRMVQKLLSVGADPNLAQTNGLTPLMIAAQTGNLEVVEALLSHDADPNAATAATGATALMWAVEESHPQIARLLIDGGATIAVSTTKGFTPLMTTARQGDLEIASILIEGGVDLNETGSDGTHALPLAIMFGQYEFAHFLLENGVNPNASMGGIYALHAAVGQIGTWMTHWNRQHGGSGLGGTFGRPGLSASGRLGVVKALLARGADPNVRIETSALVMSYIGHTKKGAFEPYACGTGDLKGATPLWVAAFGANGSMGQIFAEFAHYNRSNSSVDIINTLLDAGADLNLTTDDGTTPLMVAAGLGISTHHPGEPRGLRSAVGEEAVKALLAAGSDINAVNEADFTALHGAAFRGLNEIVELLVARGAEIDARDFRGRTPYRLAEGSKQSFQFQSWPETADLLRSSNNNREKPP